jgi:hypothetical protein
MQIIIKIFFTIVIITISFYAVFTVWKHEIDIEALLKKPFNFIPFKKNESNLLLDVTHLRRDSFVYLNADKLTDIGIYLVVKVTNTDAKTLEIADFKVELLAEGIWEKPIPIAFLNKNNLFHVLNNDYKNATRILPTQEMFDRVIKDKQLQLGETVVGIVPFEIERRLGTIEKIRFTVIDILNKSHESIIKLGEKGIIGERQKGYLQSISMEVLDKNVDLSKFIDP